jgi:cytochrome c peroxidase
MISSMHRIILVVLTILIALIFMNSQKSLNHENYEQADVKKLLENKDLQTLGEKLFFDYELSMPEGQSCAICHGPEAGWTGPDEQINVAGGAYPGAMHPRFGNRKPKSAAYATLSPVFHTVNENEHVQFFGGNFWDGRATGLKLGNPAAEQAQGPFLNPVEQNLPDAKTLVAKVCKAEYAALFTKIGSDIWGIKDICKNNDVNLQFDIIGIAIAAFENSEKVNQFSSKFDYYLKGETNLTNLEKMGLELFEGKAQCSQCHLSEVSQEGTAPLFTDFGFENIGIPSNPKNQWYTMAETFNSEGKNWIDPGLAGFLKKMPQYKMYAGENYGKHQTPTLRNVDKRPYPEFVKVYGHNGYFKSLEEIVHFYNTRDILPPPEKVANPQTGINCWPKPEVSENINRIETGNLGLSKEEELAIVEFLKTLSDGYNPNNQNK